MSITRRHLTTLAGGSGLALAAPWIQGAEAQDVLKVGVLLPLSGPIASLGNDVHRGFQMARDFVNAAGGVFGRPVEFAVADVPGSTEATSQANRLITNERVRVIVGSYASSISFAASQVAERNRVIYLEQGAVADDITTRGFRHLFRLIYPASELGNAAAEFTTDRVIPGCGLEAGKARIAILAEDSFYGVAVSEGARRWFREKGINVVDATTYSYRTNDLSSIVQRYKSLQPDILMLCQYTPDAILFWRQAREANLQVKAVVANGGGHNVNEFAEALGDDVNGIFNAGTSVFINPDGLQPETAQLFHRFHEEHPRRFDGRIPSAHTGMGFNAMWLLLNDILPAAGAMDVERIRQAALAMDKPVGSCIVGWGVRFDPRTQNNTRAFPTIDQWQHRQIRTIGPDPFGITRNITMPLPDWGQRANIGD
jgi:branched-chain amino acid transport system substrate-binding protein